MVFHVGDAGQRVAVSRQSHHDQLIILKTSATLATGFVYFYAFRLLVPLVGFIAYTNIAIEAYLEQSQMWLGLLQTPTLTFLGKIFSEKP